MKCDICHRGLAVETIVENTTQEHVGVCGKCMPVYANRLEVFRVPSPLGALTEYRKREVPDKCFDYPNCTCGPDRYELRHHL